MSPEREPMENDSNSRTAEELEQQTVDVYVERALHGPVFRMSYEHTHTYCEIFYLKSGTCTYTVNQGQWHLEAGDLFIVAAGDPHSTRYEGKTSCERIIVFCKSDVLAGMMRGDPTEVQQALERSCKVILNAETRTMVEALLDQMLLENDLPRKYSEQVLELESLHLVLLLLRNGIFSHETMSPKEGYSADIERALKYIALNYQQPLTLEEVAGYCNLSPTYFSRKFRLITGQTFKEHVNYIRLRQATQMLLMTDNSISQELVERHHDLQKLCKELDPTRSTTIAHVSHTPTDGPMHHITDLESYNHYFGWYGGKIEDNGPWLDKFHAEHPDICLGVSEYGCEGIINWHSSTPQCKDYTEEYQAVYHEYMAQAFEDRPWIWASHVWNMFDFGCAARNEGGVAGRNNKGLVTIDRKTRKDSFYLYQAYWTKDPMVHINGRRYAQRAGETTEVKVYSNQDCVTLYLNGKEVGTQQAYRVFHFTVALAEGFNTLLAVAGSAKDSITLEKVEKEPACYTLPEFNERQEGVANWFKQMGSLDLESPMEFPEGYYNIKDSMAELAKNEEAFAIVAKAVKLVTNFDLKPGQGMWSMMSGMSPEHMSGMISTDLLGDKFLPSLNAQLIKIKK